MKAYLWIFLVVLVLLQTLRKCDSIDCRKFVFAPVCRGISAKRSQQLEQAVQNIPEMITKSVPRTYVQQQSSYSKAEEDELPLTYAEKETLLTLLTRFILSQQGEMLRNEKSGH